MAPLYIWRNDLMVPSREIHIETMGMCSNMFLSRNDNSIMRYVAKSFMDEFNFCDNYNFIINNSAISTFLVIGSRYFL